MNRLRSLDPPSPVVRCEHRPPGDRVHCEVECLAHIVKSGQCIRGHLTRETRDAGYEYLHIDIVFSLP